MPISCTAGYFNNWQKNGERRNVVYREILENDNGSSMLRTACAILGISTKSFYETCRCENGALVTYRDGVEIRRDSSKVFFQNGQYMVILGD